MVFFAMRLLSAEGICGVWGRGPSDGRSQWGWGGGVGAGWLEGEDVDVGNGGADGEAEGGDEADGDVAEQAAVWADDIDEQAFVATEGAAGDAHAAAGAPCGAVEGEEFHRVAEQADGAAEAVHFCVGNDGGGGVDGVEARHASEPMGQRFCFRCACPQEDDASDCGARFEGHALADATRNFD